MSLRADIQNNGEANSDPGLFRETARFDGELASSMKQKTLMTLLAAAAAIVLIVPRPCAAGSKGGSDKQAKKLFEEGTAFFNEGKYAQAVIKFHDSYDLSHQSELLYNIAVCYEKMGQLSKASEYYGRYLDAKDEEDEESEKVKKKIEKLKKKEAGEDVEEDEEDYEDEDEEDYEDEDEEGGKKAKGGWLKKLKMPDDEEEGKGKGAAGGRAAWKHGLRFIIAGHLSQEGTLNYEEPAWSGRFGYNFRFPKGKTSLILEVGYGQTYEDYFKGREFHLLLFTIQFAYEVLEVKKRLFQLFIGGGLELHYFFMHRREVDTYLIGLGPLFEGIINVRPKLGIVIDFMPLFGYYGKSPHWAMAFLVKAGIVWGLK
jgi:tetratricopeptide (TPR) repeat protein